MKKYYVISHTHWDREWYLPFEKFRLRLLSAMDALIEIAEKNPSYVFYFDAQAAVIDDYLEIRPERAPLVGKLIRNGNIGIGPWYVQNDFYLSSGETTIRNLIYGICRSRKYGKCCMVGYAPDQFGNVSQLPQILRGFGIRSFVFGRGFAKFFLNGKGELERVPPPLEFIWQSPDGSKVTAFYLAQWYNNAQRISADGKEAAEQIGKTGEGLAPLSRLPYLLLMNGVDHLEPQGDLPECLERANAFLPEGEEAFQASAEKYVRDCIRYIEENGVILPVERGELRYGGDYDMLRGCWSSRLLLKQYNAALTARVEKIIEPLAAMCEVCGMRGIYPKDELDYVWKLILLNSTHDAICGCSSDSTCRHLVDRYERIDEITSFLLRELEERAARSVASAVTDDDSFVLLAVNTLPYGYDGVIRAKIDLPVDWGEEGFDLFSAEGEKIPFSVLGARDHKKDVITPLNLPQSVPMTEYETAFSGTLPPYSFNAFYLKKSTEKPKDFLNGREGFTHVNPRIENDYYVISYENGRLFLTVKERGERIADFFSVTDEGDAGDAYVFRGTGESPLRFLPSEARAEEASDGNGAILSRLTVGITGEIPSSYDFANGRRSAERKVFRLDAVFLLRRGSDVIEIEYFLNNPSLDHRMKAVFSTGIGAKKIFTDIPFDISVSDGSHFDPRTTDRAVFAQSFGFVRGRKGYAALLNRGNCDYSLEKGAVSVTLVRSTGVISRPADGSQNGDVWNDAKENEQTGEIRGVLGLVSGRGAPDRYAIAARAARFVCGVPVCGTSVNEARLFTGKESLQTASVEGKFVKQNPWSGIKLRSGKTVVSVGGKAEVSAFKLGEKTGEPGLRLFNRTGRAQSVSVRIDGYAVAKARLSESRISPFSEGFSGKANEGKILTFIFQKNTDKSINT